MRRQIRAWIYYYEWTSVRGPGEKVLVEIPVGTAATASSGTVIPAGAVVTRVYVDVTTPYSSGATISVGQTGNVSLVAGPNDSSPQTANVYDIFQRTAWGSALAGLVTVAGSPAAGAAIVGIEYAVPLS